MAQRRGAQGEEQGRDGGGRRESGGAPCAPVSAAMRRAERLGAGSGPGRDSPGKGRGVGQVSTPVGRRGSGATRIGAGSRRGPLGVRCAGGAGRGGVAGGSALRGWEGGADGLRKAEGRNRIWGDGGAQRGAGDGRERLGEVGAGGQAREAHWGGGGGQTCRRLGPVATGVPWGATFLSLCRLGN